MNKVSVNLGTWKRCNIEGLNIAASLCGEKHEFVFNKQKFILYIPKKPKIKNERSISDDISLSSWRNHKTGIYPLSYDVHKVNIFLDNEKVIEVPDKCFNHISSNNFTKREQQRYEKIINIAEESILEAFEYWKLIMRWKTGIFNISPPFESNMHHSWSAYLTDLKTRKRFYPATTTITIYDRPPITKRQWNKVERSLINGKSPDIWDKFYIEAHHRKRVNDFHGCIISLAIAVESSIRSLMVRHLRSNPNNEFEKMVNRVNLTQIINKWVKLGFNTNSWKQSLDTKNINYIIETRNTIMHRGLYNEIEDSKMSECFSAVRMFLDQTNKELAK